MNRVIGKSGNRVIDGVIDWAIGRRRRTCAPNSSINYPITRLPDYPIFSLRASGFTLIELLVVLTLIVVLASIGMTQYKTSIVHSREAVLKEDLFRMRDAIDQYYADKGKYPSALDALVSEHYLRSIPEDPITKSTSSWQTVPAESDPNNPTTEPGIYDVKSGSEATALDGTKYSDW